jgi:hypothetical protein
VLVAGGASSGVIARATTAAEVIAGGSAVSVVLVEVMVGLCVAIVTEVGVSAVHMGVAVGVLALPVRAPGS